MDEIAVCEVVRFDKSMPVIVIHHTNYTSREYVSHWHLDMEISILYEGKIDNYINGKHVELIPGEFCLINSREVHSAVPHIEKKAEKIVGFTMIINYNFLNSMIEDFPNSYFRVDGIRERQEIAVLLYQISDLCMKEQNDSLNFQLLGLVSQILSILCLKCKYKISDLGVNQQKDYERIRIILEYIHGHYKEPLKQQEVAKKFYFSRGYFASFFKKYTGKSFLSYLTEVRLVEAKKLLTETRKSVLNIALEVGFCDERRFIETFKEAYLMTPGNFRKKNMTK